MYFCLRFCIYAGNTLYLYRRQQIQLLVWAEQFFNWFYGDVCFIHELQLFYTQISRLFRYNIFHPTQESGSCIVFACISSRCRFTCCIRLCIVFNRFVLKFTLLISIHSFTLHYSALLYRWTRNSARFGRCFGNSTTTNLLYTSMCVHPKCYIQFLLLSGYMNTAIHAIMYTYYLLTILRPEIKANKELKKNITRIQMVIFLDYFTWLESFCLPVYDPLTISIQFPTNLWFCVYFLFNKFWGIFGCHSGVKSGQTSYLCYQFRSN